jgi:hypothetical protein
LTVSGSQRHHPLPEPPAVNNLENKNLPYIPVPEPPAKYSIAATAVEHKILPQAPFVLPENDSHRNHRAAPPSPIVTSATRSHPPEPPGRKYQLSNDEESPPDSPIFKTATRVSALAIQGNNFAFLSILSRAFVVKIRSLEHVRELFCAFEYPESFTGKEAVVSFVMNVQFDSLSRRVLIINPFYRTL